MILLYIAIDIFLIGFIFYSWYCQATIEFRARFRISSIIWALIFILIGFQLDYFNNPDITTNIFLAIFILLSVIDGWSGLAKKKLVLSGYFKRTLNYSEVSKITLIQVPNAKKTTVLAIFQTSKKRSYYLRFSKQVTDVITALRQYLGKEVVIEIQKMM